MTGVTLTPKQERFCQLYIELGNASEAYRQSYDADSMNENTVNREAHALLENPKISTRLNLVREEHQSRHNLSVDDLLKELEEARQAALKAERPQSAAAVAATMGKAKLLGLDKQIVEVTGKDGGAIKTETTAIPSLTLEELAGMSAQDLSQLCLKGKT